MLGPIDPNALGVRGTPQPPINASVTGKNSFQNILEKELERPKPLRFSAHAEQRLNARNIALSPGQIEQAGQAVDSLDAKGARESLLLMDGTALVVNVPNRTVITAVPTDEMSQTIFTQIDSAVVVGNGLPETTSTTGPAPEWGGLTDADRLMRRSLNENYPLEANTP